MIKKGVKNHSADVLQWYKIISQFQNSQVFIKEQ